MTSLAKRGTDQQTTISTQISQTAQSVKLVIPKWCNNFADVFSKKTHDKLPPHHPYDHTIKLYPDFVPKITKVYSLNPTEMETCKSFVEEHLEIEWIISLKSSQASPFFFVPKKDGTLHPCQDYHYLNFHTVQNTYPLPLILELIDDMKESTLCLTSSWSILLCIHPPSGIPLNFMIDEEIGVPVVFGEKEQGKKMRRVMRFRMSWMKGRRGR